MIIRIADETDYNELVLMKWEHGAEDDIDYSVYEITKETNLSIKSIKELENLLQADPEDFIKEYCAEES